MISEALGIQKSHSNNETYLKKCLRKVTCVVGVIWEATLGPKGPQNNFGRVLGPSGAIWDHLGPFRTNFEILDFGRNPPESPNLPGDPILGQNLGAPLEKLPPANHFSKIGPILGTKPWCSARPAASGKPFFKNRAKFGHKTLVFRSTSCLWQTIFQKRDPFGDSWR